MKRNDCRKICTIVQKVAVAFIHLSSLVDITARHKVMEQYIYLPSDILSAECSSILISFSSDINVGYDDFSVKFSIFVIDCIYMGIYRCIVLLTCEEYHVKHYTSLHALFQSRHLETGNAHRNTTQLLALLNGWIINLYKNP